MKAIATTFSPFLFVLLIVRVHGSSQDHHWIKVGTYARYSNDSPPFGPIVFPNGTKVKFVSLDSPIGFEWRAVEINGSSACLNLTFSISGSARVILSDLSSFDDHVDYRKTFLVDVDLETSEADTVDGGSLGKIALWGDANVGLGGKITLSSAPSGVIVGNVTDIRRVELAGRRIGSYNVEAFQLDPFVLVDYAFDQQTGIALSYTLVGPVRIVEGSTHTHSFENGTVYKITSYAKNRLSELLGLEGTYVLTLSETSVEFGERVQSRDLLWYGVGFVVLFVSLSAVFVFVDRRKHKGSRHQRRLR